MELHINQATPASSESVPSLDFSVYRRAANVANQLQTAGHDSLLFTSKFLMHLKKEILRLNSAPCSATFRCCQEQNGTRC